MVLKSLALASVDWADEGPAQDGPKKGEHFPEL